MIERPILPVDQPRERRTTKEQDLELIANLNKRPAIKSSIEILDDLRMISLQEHSQIFSKDENSKQRRRLIEKINFILEINQNGKKREIDRHSGRNGV